MEPARGGPHRQRGRDLVVLVLQGRERHEPVFSPGLARIMPMAIDIDDEDAARLARHDPIVRLGICLPPARDLIGVQGCLVRPMAPGDRLFAPGPARKHPPSALGASQGFPVRLDAVPVPDHTATSASIAARSTAYRTRYRSANAAPSARLPQKYVGTR